MSTVGFCLPNTRAPHVIIKEFRGMRVNYQRIRKHPLRASIIASITNIMQKHDEEIAYTQSISLYFRK